MIKDKYSNGEFTKLYKHLMKQGFYNNGWNHRYGPFLKNVNSRLDYYCEAFEYFKGLNVLDVGCFSGFYSFLISDYANKVIGIDIQEDTIAFADILSYRLNSGNVEFELKSFSEFFNESYHIKYNINGLLLHKVMGDFHKEDFDILDSIAENMKIIITVGPYFEKYECFKNSQLENLFIHENIKL